MKRVTSGFLILPAILFAALQTSSIAEADGQAYSFDQRVGSGAIHTCAIDKDSQLHCWGWNGQDQTELPSNLDKVSSVDASYAQTCVITSSEGKVACWGWKYYGQQEVPSQLSKAKELAVGYYTVCAIDDKDFVQCWGGETPSYTGGLDVPKDLGKVLEISGKDRHFCAITILHEARCWGYNYSGQADVPQDLGKVISISAGNDGTCAVKNTGSITCWGFHYSGVPNNPYSQLNFREVSTDGYRTVCGITDEKDLKCWGFSSNIPVDLGKVTKVTTSGEGVCAINLNDALVCWSEGYYKDVLQVPAGFSRVLPKARNLINTPLPIITGISIVNGVLNINLGVWDSGVSFGYQWLRDGVEIPGATLADYEPGLADLGKSITVRVTGSKDGYKSVSLESSPVAVSRLKVSGSPCGVAGNLDVALDLTTSKPVISGNASFGQIVKGSNGVWASGTKACVFWMSGNQAVPLVKTGSYKLQVSDVGKEVRFVVVGTKNNVSTVRISDEVLVSKAVFTKSKAPIIRGVAKVGVKLSGLVSSWESGTSYTYQWLRDYEPIVGANTLNYIPTAADNGSNLSLRVCGSKAYYEDLCMSSSSQIVQPGVITKAGTVSISGMSTNPGALLTGVTTQWMAGVNLQSQWLLNGSPIQGATNPQLVIQPSYRGGTLTYQVTGSMDGYQSITKTSTGKKIP